MSFSRFYVCSSLSAQCYNSTAGGDRLRDAVFCFPGSQGILQGNNAKAGSKPLAGKELTMNFGSNLRKLRKEKNLVSQQVHSSNFIIFFKFNFDNILKFISFKSKL